MRLILILMLTYPFFAFIQAVDVAVRHSDPVYLLDVLPLGILFASASTLLFFRGTAAAATPALGLCALVTITRPLASAAVLDEAGLAAYYRLPIAYHLESLLVPVASLAAFVLLIRHFRTSRLGLARLGVLTALALVTEAMLMGLAAAFGFGGMSREWYQSLLLLTQLPGVALLAPMGLCCSHDAPLVFSDWVVPHWADLPILVVANTVGLLLLFTAFDRISSITRERKRSGSLAA
jgi:hypothetical protein